MEVAIRKMGNSQGFASLRVIGTDLLCKFTAI